MRTGSSQGVLNINEGGLHRRLRAIIARATDAVFNMMLERCMVLSDQELMIFVRAIRNCGQTSNECGQLLPALFYEVSRSALIGNANPGQNFLIISIVDFSVLDWCIHGRSIRPDALDRIAGLIRVNSCESPERVRHVLASRLAPGVCSDLLKLCSELRSLVRAAQQDSTSIPPEAPWWEIYFYGPLTVIETLAGQKEDAS